MNFYKMLSGRNDLKALLRGRYPQRVVRKTIFKHAFRLAGFACRLMGVGR